ncbi:hypothetical protein H0O02_03360 [Candidatus Micrarchaeota archaeon]|nr:hypothetical protein [Candidatus Micrarchaeota archaeon]
MFDKNASSRKGQAAMEYLMTYGWAILVIVIVLAILAFYLPTLIKTPESCLFSQPGFSCDVKKPVIVSESGTNEVYVIMRLDNQQAQGIIVKGIICTTAAAAEIDKSKAYAITGLPPVPSGGNVEFTSTLLGQKVYCIDDKTPANRVVAVPNADFRGTIGILYSYVNEVEGAPDRLATATLTGTVLAP